MASPMPVLPEVPSMIVPPGFSWPARSASSIILTAIRSLIELPGLKVSSFASTSAFTTPLVIELIRTMGVSPMASRIVAAIFLTELVYVIWRSCRFTSIRPGQMLEAFLPLVGVAERYVRQNLQLEGTASLECARQHARDRTACGEAGRRVPVRANRHPALQTAFRRCRHSPLELVRSSGQ